MQTLQRPYNRNDVIFATQKRPPSRAYRLCFTRYPVRGLVGYLMSSAAGRLYRQHPKQRDTPLQGTSMTISLRLLAELTAGLLQRELGRAAVRERHRTGEKSANGSHRDHGSSVVWSSCRRLATVDMCGIGAHPAPFFCNSDRFRRRPPRIRVMLSRKGAFYGSHVSIMCVGC